MVNTKSRACDSCYKRKIRCDAAERGGICEWCQEHEFECTFTRKKRRTGPKTASAADNDANGSQIQTLGDLMASTSLPKEEAPALSTTSTPGSRTSTSSVCSVCRPRLAGPVTGQTLGRMHIFGETFGVNCSRNGLPHLTSKCEEWIFSRTGRWPRFQHIYGEAENHPRNTIDSMRSSTFADSRADLPPLLVVQSLFAQYINSDYSMVFPVVDRILFEETIQVAYSPHSDTDSDEYLCAKACVFAFVAMANSQFPPPSGILKLTSDQYIKEAQILLADVMENTSLAALQTCFMILQYQCLCGQFQASSKYHSIACRLIFALGGHTTSFPRPKDRALTLREREDRQLRLLFWLCYCFDKDIALRTGQPPIIDDSFCNLELPEGYLETHFNMQQKSIADDMATPCLIGDLRLSIIKSKAIRTLYSVSASQKTDAELIRSIRELDEDLENWRVSVPEAFTPALSIRKDVAHADALRQGSRSMLHIELHLDYLHLLNTIHWASGRCFVSSDAGMSFGVKSSLDLTTEASRSIIIYLSSAAHRLVGEAFWVFIFYPVTALMALFFSILHYPHEPDAAQDLQLLRKVSEIIRSMPVPRLTIAEVEYLGKMDIFVAELSRLAEHAIQKAQEIQM